MQGNIIDLIPAGIRIEKQDVTQLFYRLCRQSEYKTPPSFLREVVNEIADALDEGGYPLSIEIKDIPHAKYGPFGGDGNIGGSQECCEDYQDGDH